MVLSQPVARSVRTKCLKAAALAGTALLMGAPTITFAQTAAPAADPSAAPQQPTAAPIVQRIQITGNQRIETGTVQSYLPVRPGQPIDQVLIDAALKTLFATGLFADAGITFEQGVLNVVVLENPIVNRVIFEGNRASKEEDFVEEIQLEPRAVYTRAKAQSDAQRIIEVYRRTGRFAATVTPTIVELPQNRVDVVFEIEEGNKTGVAKINFRGNEAFSDAELRGAVLTAESRWWNLLESNDNYDPDRLEFDRELLREFYTKQGYADFSVTSAVAELTPDRQDFFITYSVDEGPQYNFGKVSVQTTLDRISDRQLAALLPIREGMQFNSEFIERAQESITFATGVAGYAFVEVNPRMTMNRETNTVDVEFEVNEGPRVYVERINLRGNTQTLDRVIRREMRLAEGDAFNRVLVDRSSRRIRGLGYFSDVAIEELPGSAPDRTVLDVAVTEQPTGSFQVGAGLSSANSFILNFQVEQRNLLGRGQYLLLDLSTSELTSRVRLSFTEPYFLDRRLRAGLSTFLTRTDFEEAGYVATTIGGGGNVGFNVSEFGSISINYQLRSDDVRYVTNAEEFLDGRDPEDVLIPGIERGDVGGNDDEDNVWEFTNADETVIRSDICNFLSNQLDPTCQSNGEFLTSSIGYNLRFDRRNDPLFPSAGWRIDLGQTFAGVGGNVNYLRTNVRGSIYQRLPFRVIGSLTADVGYIDGFGDDGVRINDRFFKGGNGGFRGFDVAGVGPRYFEGTGDRSAAFDRALGGRAFAIGSAEALLPLPFPPEFGLQASLFSDFGSVGIVDESDKRLNQGDDVFCLNNPDDPDIARARIQTTLEDAAEEGFTECFKPVEDDFSLRLTTGISVNWRSPFGPIQFDLAAPILYEDYDETQSFRFSAGRAF